MRPESKRRCAGGIRSAVPGWPPGAWLVATYFCAVSIFLAPPCAFAQDLGPSARLVAAARAGDAAGMARALAEGAAPDARNRLGETALLIALKRERPDLAQQMIAAGTDINLAAVNGVTPLMAAAHAGYADIVRVLLARGVDVNAADQVRKTAMIYAAGEGRTEVVVLLLHAGIDPNAVYAHELTALMWAAGYGHDETVKALLDAGAQRDRKDDRGKTALDLAREGNYPATVQLLEAAARG